MKVLSKSISTFLFTILTSGLVVIAFISYQKINQFNRSVEAVMHTKEVKSKMLEVASNLKDAHVGQRGYLLTNDTAFLEPYIGAKQNKNLLFDSLKLLMRDNVEQQENLITLKRLIEERYFLLNKSLELSKNTHPDPLLNSALQNGNFKMDEVQKQISLMLRAEDKLLLQRTQVKDRSAILTPIFLLLVSLVSIAVISLFFFRLQKETSERISITESNKLLQMAKQETEISEKRFRTLTQNIPHMIWTAGPDGNKNFFNQYFYDYTGLNFEELKGDGMLKIIHPDDLEKDLALWQNSLQTGEDLNIEKRIRQHDGTYRWHISRAIAQKDLEGNITEWIGSSTEIEVQKKTEEVLTKAEEQFRTFANSIQNLAWIADSEGWIYWYNQRWFDYTGTTLEEMQGWGWQKTHHPDHIANILELMKVLWSKAEPFELTFPLRRYDGEFRWFLTRAYPVIDAQGKIERWIGTNTDITEQKSSTEELELKVKERTAELELQNQTFELAESISNFGTYRWNTTTGELEYSDSLFRLLDCKPQEFVPTMEKFLSFIHPDDLQQVISNGEQTSETGELIETPYRIVTKLGTIKHFRSSGRFINVENSRLLVGTVQDVSKDVMASRDLKAKNTELENANSELASFSYVASHDLQEPLRKIQGFAKRITEKDGENLSETTKDYFNRIIAAAKRMQNLIESLLSFSSSSHSESVFEKTDLNQILDEVLIILNESITKQNAVIESQLLPTINAVPVQMHQLFLNLISNSLKYSKPNVPPHIKIIVEHLINNEIAKEVGHEAATWKITINDNGIGFEQQYENKIFEPFQRLHGKTEYTGTGIGLTICKKIIQKHNGTITATGQSGIGSTFTLFLSENT
ncbi:MAG: PAS domain-containing protein [Saprospiraceae bacterium]